jgi:hypothetical protein
LLSKPCRTPPRFTDRTSALPSLPDKNGAGESETRKDGSEKRTFKCSRCNFTETKTCQIRYELPQSNGWPTMSNRPREENLSLIQIAINVGMSCALTAFMAVGIFMVIRVVAWVG